MTVTLTIDAVVSALSRPEAVERLTRDIEGNTTVSLRTAVAEALIPWAHEAAAQIVMTANLNAACDAEADRARDAAVRKLVSAAVRVTNDGTDRSVDLLAEAIVALRAHLPEGE